MSSHTLANNRLLTDLLTDAWDGRNLDAHLAELDAEAAKEQKEVQTEQVAEHGEHPHHVYCPLDPRLMLNAQGKLELIGQERNISIPPSIKASLDALTEKLLTRWRNGDISEQSRVSGAVDASKAAEIQPWTLRTIVEELRSLGWQDVETRNAHLYVRAWLLRCTAVVRVGQDYWLPADALPQEVQRTRLRVLPIYTPRLKESATAIDATGNEYHAPERQRTLRESRSEHEVIIDGEATAMRAVWSQRLRTAHLLQGFLPIPARARVALPPPAPGEQARHILQGVWYDDNTHFWLWLDREHSCFYSPLLADKLAWQAAGDIIHITWEESTVVLRITGHDDEIENEESRLVDLDALSTLRGGLGESYRRSLQEILSGHPEGLPFGAIVKALRERQQHEVHRGTVHAILTSGGFLQRERRWFAASDSELGARHLRNAFIETIVIQEQQEEKAVVHDEKTRVRAIRIRLAEIVKKLET